jgi:diacylglycerol kinase (ATP)
LSRLFQDIDYEGFRLFVDTFLEVETPEELCRHLFLSFVKRHEARPQALDGKALKVSSRNSRDALCFFFFFLLTGATTSQQ